MEGTLEASLRSPPRVPITPSLRPLTNHHRPSPLLPPLPSLPPFVLTLLDRHM